MAGIIGTDFTVLVFAQKIYEGFTNMTDIFLLSIRTTGLAALVEKTGGIDFVIHKIKSRIKIKKLAQMGIGTLVSFTYLTVVNNMVSIIITGAIAK